MFHSTKIDKTTEELQKLKDSKNISNKNIRDLLIQQVNELMIDIKELEDFRDYVKSMFPKNTNFNSIHIIDNKLKTMTQFYSTILNYKQELIKLLLKLEEIIKPQYEEKDIMNIVKSVIDRLTNDKEVLKRQEEKLIRLLEKHGDKFIPTNDKDIKQDFNLSQKIIDEVSKKNKNI